LLTGKSAFLSEAAQRRALIKVAENMKISWVAPLEKWRCHRARITFFRGKMENYRGAGATPFPQRYLVTGRRLQRNTGSAVSNVTKWLNSVHTLFTPDDSLAPCQRREIRNAAKDRQEKI
jgi:hypothetical protein